MDRQEAPVEQNRLAADCLLAEFQVLHHAINSHLTAMNILTVAGIGVLGTLLSLVASEKVKVEESILLVFPLVGFAFGLIVYFLSVRISQFGHYIRDRIAKNLQELSGNSMIMGWEGYVREEEKKQFWLWRWMGITGAHLLIFIVASFFVLLFTHSYRYMWGPSWEKLWYADCVLTVGLFVLFVYERMKWLS